MNPSVPSLDDLLKATSRSFYLTLRVLPAPVRPQVGLAYLLARTSDTIADTELVSVDDRIEALSEFRARILGESYGALSFGELKSGCALPAEKLLLERAEEAVAVLDAMPDHDKILVRDVLRIIIGGQELDLKRFSGACAKNIISLETEADLDDYTYRVAGCVGEFWTKICRAHLFPNTPVDGGQLLEKGIRFGKGLQMINILRDIPRDLRQGRCYLPVQTLAAVGLIPDDLLGKQNLAKFQPLYNKWLDQAESHLAAGWEYTNMLPRGQMRLRLACAWPILIGARTIKQLRRGNVLDEAHRIKISRSDVRSILVRSVVAYPFKGRWARLFAGELE